MVGIRACCVIAEEKTSRDRKPRIAHGVRIAQEARKAMPVGQINFRLRAVNDGFAECDREADGRVVDLIVVRIVVHEPPKIVGIQPDLA